MLAQKRNKHWFYSKHKSGLQDTNVKCCNLTTDVTTDKTHTHKTYFNLFILKVKLGIISSAKFDPKNDI